jgi:hypothetical protein
MLVPLHELAHPEEPGHSSRSFVFVICFRLSPPRPYWMG